jgi:hypothetical protein
MLGKRGDLRFESSVFGENLIHVGRQISSGLQRCVFLGMYVSAGEVMTFGVEVATLELTPVVARSLPPEFPS